MNKEINSMILLHCFLKDEIDISEFNDLFWRFASELGDALDVGNGEGAIDERTARKVEH